MKKQKFPPEIERISRAVGQTAELVRLIKVTAYTAENFAKPDLYISAIEASSEVITERLIDLSEDVRQLGL